MESKFIKITNRNEWQDLLNKVLFKTFFHNIEWEEFLEKQFKWLKFERYVWANQALLSLARVGDKLISHPFCEYGGPMPLIENIDVEIFKNDLISEFKNQLRISFHPYSLVYFQGSQRKVLDSSDRVTYLLEELDLRKTARHEIEKAIARNFFQIEKCQSPKDLNDFYNLYIKSAKSHKIPAYPRSFFEYFFTSKESEIILAKKDGKVIAGSVFIFYDKFVHYFQNSLDKKYKNLGVNYLILWVQIKKYLEGNRIFDFGGTRIGSPLQIFKAGWGGKEYPIYELKNYEGGVFRDSKLRDIFGLLPLFLIKKLSPYLLKYKL